MTATVEVFGDILRDSTNESKRNYVNLQIVVKDEERFVMAYHLTNYAPNAATLLHRLTIKSYTSLTECDRAYTEKRMAKLSKDRVVFKTVSKKYEGTEESMKEMSDMLSDIHFKVEIKKAVEEIFGVKVAKVNTISVRGRYRRQGMHAGYTAKSKKAIVTLTADSKEIEFFNSMV